MIDEPRDPTCHRKLRRFWIELPKSISAGKSFALGVGVTDDSLESALRVVQRDVLRGVEAQPVRILEDIDVSTLDPTHILPHMGVAAVRGIWYPLRY